MHAHVTEAVSLHLNFYQTFVYSFPFLYDTLYIYICNIQLKYFFIILWPIANFIYFKVVTTLTFVYPGHWRSFRKTYFSVQRRFSDFIWLRERLRHCWPGPSPAHLLSYPIPHLLVSTPNAT